MEQGISTFTPAVIVTWSLVAVSLLALGTLAYSAIRNRTRQVDLQREMEAFQAPDVEAFRNLTDPAEEDYLRNHLSPAKFRSIKRQRTWAALVYTWEVGRAARALTLVGQVQKRSTDPTVKAAGVQNTDDALWLLLRTAQVIVCLAVEFVLPGLRTNAVLRLLEQYRRSAHTLLRLTPFAAGSGSPSSKGA